MAIRQQGVGWLLAGLVVSGAVSASALINPKFTPDVLVRESQVIVAGAIGKGSGPSLFVLKVAEPLKGDQGLKTVTVDISKAVSPEQGQFFADLVGGDNGKVALFFLGKFSEAGQPEGGDMDAAGTEGDAAEAGGGDAKAFIHVGASWFDLTSMGAGKPYLLEQKNAHMEGTWAGSSDMLERAVKYALADDTAEFPATAGVEWQPAFQIGTLTGGLEKVRAVDLAGNGKASLHVQGAGGDRLYRYDGAGQAFKDITAERKLGAKSRLAAWSDFNGDGTLDLASVDGKALTLWAQQADGTFAARPVVPDPDMVFQDMVAADVGGAGLVVFTGAKVVMLSDLGGGAVTKRLLPEGGATLAAGGGGRVLVADFTGDSIADILVAAEQSGILYSGKGGGVFGVAAACPVALGAGASSACVGDFDQDGLLDVVAVADDAVRVWQNLGGGRFSDLRHVSGEINYISKGGGVDCGVCDVNNDGLQDILIAYAGQAPHIFFGRGFRSFGHAHEIDVAEKGLLPAAEAGQKTGCVADFNDDGIQDMILGLPNGDVWGFLRSGDRGSSLVVRVGLPLKHAFKGPVLVKGAIGNRSLGAWNVQPGVQDACFGIRDAGTVTLTWRIAGGAETRKDALVVSKPVRVVIP